MKTYEERREQERQFERDVEYDVWRAGGDPDRVDRDRVQDNFYNGVDATHAANIELHKQRPRPQEPEQDEQLESEETP